MSTENAEAKNGQQHHFYEDGQDYVSAWHSPDSEPDGKSHGSGAICFVSPGEVVIGSAGGKHGWEIPGGRPEANEDWRTTLDREVLEEVCAEVQDATLLGFVRVECLTGREKGLVLVRSVWIARVVLNEWKPQHEIKHRRVVSPEESLELVSFPAGQLPIYRRWFNEAIRFNDFR